MRPITTRLPPSYSVISQISGAVGIMVCFFGFLGN